MKAKVFQNKNAWSILVAAIAIASLAWSVASLARAIDHDILFRLLAAIDPFPSLPDNDPRSLQYFLKSSYAGYDLNWTNSLQLTLVMLFSSVAAWSAFKLSAFARVLVLVQLFVLSVLAIMGLKQFLQIQAHPICYFIAVFAGCLAGYCLRLMELRRRKQEAQYYELLLRNKELQETKLLLVKQDEIERRMLAADLHDQVLNDLKAVRQKLDSYINSQEPALADSIKSLLNQAMDEIREVMDSLCPSALEHLGLVAAMEDCLRRGAERGGFKVRFKNKVAGDEFAALSMVEQSLLYRLVQESVTNICKHADASLVRGTVELEGDQLIVKVADNGRGIDPSRLREDSRGVRYMRQRADLIGATIAWRPGEDGKGTTVEIRISLTGRENAESSSSGRRTSVASARNGPDTRENSGTA
jgi:signal transduction histidine kinase